MSPNSRRLALGAGAAALLGLGVALGLGLDRISPDQKPAPAAEGRKVLYWYDPMVPAQRFDAPGKSPYMDMDLVPRYADEAEAESGIRVDPARVQNLGVRYATVEKGVLPSDLTAAGVVAFNQRDVAIVQARAAGFVQRVYGRAPGDVVRAGAPLADVLAPEWGGAQAEYLAVRRTGDPDLVAAARQRLVLLGMPAGVIRAVERTGRPQTVHTISTPTGGVIRTLSVRAGMTVAQGQTLAEVNGLSSVWVEAAIPEALAGQVREGQSARVTLAAYPGETFSGRLSAVLPEAVGESRTLTGRVELPNAGGRLRPGMYAQVLFDGPARPALLVPSEAVIRTGRRTLVMLALPDGRFRPAQVEAGREAGGRTEILAGLSDGERIVASGQFLLDSEASLAGAAPRPIGAAPSAAAPTAALHQGTGRIEKIDAAGITLSHGPIASLGWPAMTMLFRLEDAALARGLKPGDQVAFAFDQPAAGPTVRRLQKASAR